MQRKFLRDILLCLLPCLIAGIVVFRAYQKYESGEGGFKLGVDLVGGTILIYEVDQERERQRRNLEKGGDNTAAYGGAKTSQALAEAIKRRIDPDDVQNIMVRPAGDNRIEVILPTGSHRQNAEGKKNVSTGQVEEIRRLIEQVGSLEFRIVANQADDGPAFTRSEEDLPPLDLTKDDDRARAEKLKALALGGDSPPNPVVRGDENWEVRGEKAKYAWVELHQNARKEMHLLNRYENTQDETELKNRDLWAKLAEARKNQTVYRYTPPSRDGSTLPVLLFSRECVNVNLPEKVRKEKKYEYFMLTRFSDRVEVDGNQVTITATAGNDPTSFKPQIEFSFNSVGARQFSKITSRNIPDQEGKRVRQLAIILNGMLISDPSIQSVISDRGRITGEFEQNYVNEVVKLLRSGALPATLKQKPVSENTIGPTLGADTIKSGTRAVGLAFLAVLVFMVFYYRFAGVVASIALLANLLLTVGFMVAVNATFTLPGLAGLVLMLGMAVDANVLIYERLREERDRGANLQMAIRNAYDRAFPTIIDTHLSSIFTAIVLYAVGNDQLRGFGVSLTAGLIISLFTSLFMTRLLFDIFLKKNWITNLRMLRLLSKPNIDFMKIRKPMLTFTAVLTVLGLGLFLLRSERGLNVDFVGGTVYGGQLKNEVTIGKLRELMEDSRQSKLLAIESVEKVVDQGGKDSRDVYLVKYVAEKEPRRIELALGLEGKTSEEKLANLKSRASHVPDSSVEQNFMSDSAGDKSKFFTVRTTEKEPELVQAEIDILFRDDSSKKSLLNETSLTYAPEQGESYTWILSFNDPDNMTAQYASEAFIRTLLEREFRAAIDASNAVLEPFRLQGVGEAKDGRYTQMKLSLSPEARNVIDLFKPEAVLAKVAQEYKQRPQPERLETFDPTLAGETRTRALVAILASWAAILLYLWFRFGNWTFGLAAVICLIHDLCFTLGVIAACHYVSDNFFGRALLLQDFKIDFAAVAALLTLVGYSVNDTIVVFDRIREVRGKNPLLTSQMINDSVNQTLSRTILASLTTWLVVIVLYIFGGDGVHLFAFVMVVGVVVGTYSSIYVASPLLLIFGEGRVEKRVTGMPAALPHPREQPAPA
ncbi:MAG: protein translocase subunit SecD [Planctomycetes bacterium]|nr:protein translocase subunit SecD [Planctomycetota bacterium]